MPRQYLKIASASDEVNEIVLVFIKRQDGAHQLVVMKNFVQHLAVTLLKLLCWVPKAVLQ